MFVNLHTIRPWLFQWKSVVSRMLVGCAVILVAAGGAYSGVTHGVLPWLEIQAPPPNTSKSQINFLMKTVDKQIRAGEYESAKTLLQQVLRLDPQHRDAQKKLQSLVEKHGVSMVPTQEALASAQQDGINVENLTAQDMVDAAKAMMRDGDYANAEVTLSQALAKAKDDALRRQIRSYLTAIRKDREKKEAVAQAQLDYNLSEIEKMLQKAIIYIENKQYDKAEVELQRVKQIMPENEKAEALLNRINQERQANRQQQSSQTQIAQDKKNAELKKAADVLFNEGVQLYQQGQIIEAWGVWDQALQTYPDHQATSTYMANTRYEYEQAVEQRKAQQEHEEQEQEFEEMLDTEIPQYSTQGERVDVKDVYSLMSTLSGLNHVLGENVEGNVALDVRNTTVRGILNRLQKQYGFVWNREGDTIYIEAGFETRVFPLEEGQYKTLAKILNDPSVLEDPNRNLRTILYGPQEEFDVPGKALYLNESSRSLVVTDTPENLRIVEAFLKDMPRIVGDQRPVETRVYRLDRDIANDIFEIVKLALYQGQGSADVRDQRRKLFLEPESNTMIVIDYIENLQTVENILADQQITRSLEEGELSARQFQVTDVDDVEDTPEAFARREEFVSAVADVITQMLYGREGREAAIQQGRQIFPNPEKGTIDVVDTKENIRRVEEYLSTIRGESTQEILIETFSIDHLDVFQIADALAFLFFDSEDSTRSTFISQDVFESIGTDETADDVGDVGNLFEETTRQRFNLTGGAGGGTDLLQFFSLRIYPDVNTNSIVVLTPDQEVLDLVSRIINTFDKPQRMVEIESRIVTVDLNDLRSINFDYVLTDPFLSTEDISINPEKSEQIFNLSNDQTGQEGFNLSLRTFGESRLNFILNLLETTTSLNLISAPKFVTVANPIDPPRLFVGQQIPFTDDVEFEDQGDDDPTNNRLSVDFERTLAGVTLVTIPFILNDDHIYIELAPQVVEAGERLPVQITDEVPPGQEIPNIGPLLLNQKFIQTSVRLKNGSTVVLGGLIDERENENRENVPFLSRIPLLGTIFTDRRIEKVKNSTLMFVTARIIEPEY